MLNIEIYEEAMCCSTGVCGPEPDETLIKTNQINEYLKQNQIEVQRYNMSNNPNEFIKNKEAIRLIQEKGIRETIAEVSKISDDKDVLDKIEKYYDEVKKLIGA